MSPAETITREFRGTWHGQYGVIPTPGHSDKDRGTKVVDSEDGSVAFFSYNGVGDEWRELKDECRRRGLIPERDQAPAWRVTGTYEFCDAAGTVLYRTRRHEHPEKPKRYTAERPDGKGGWVNGIVDVPRVLYRLPELLAADPTEPVYFVEGERKADKLAELGFVATAIAFGAKGWRKEYARALAGRTVLILPDNDEPGHQFADKVSATLSAEGAAVAVIKLPWLPPKGDIMDWRGTADELRALALEALNPAAALNAPAETFPLCDLALWATTEPAAKPFAVERFIPKGEVTLASGVGGSNKSLLGQQLCTCYAAGTPLLGLHTAGGATLYLTAEDDERELHWRQAHIARALSLPLEGLIGQLHLTSIRGRLDNQLATFASDGRMSITPALQILKATIAATGAKLIVLDNVAHLFGGNENDRAQVTGFVNALYGLCNEFDSSVVLIAHPNKAGDDYSGSTAWPNAVRSHIVIRRPEGAADPDLRQLSVAKANYARTGDEIAFRWHDFALILDTDLPADTRAELAANAMASGDNLVFLTCLEAATRQGLRLSANVSPSYAPTTFEGMPEARGLKKDRLAAAMKRLLSLGKIEQTRFRDTAKGRDTAALIIVDQTTPHARPNASRTLSPHAPARPPEPPPHTYASTTYSDGAALGAAAPPDDGEDLA